MRLNHIHFAVRDLPAAIVWLDQVWDVRPTFRNERMAEIPFGSITLSDNGVIRQVDCFPVSRDWAESISQR